MILLLLSVKLSKSLRNVYELNFKEKVKLVESYKDFFNCNDTNKIF